MIGINSIMILSSSLTPICLSNTSAISITTTIWFFVFLTFHFSKWCRCFEGFNFLILISSIKRKIKVNLGLENSLSLFDRGELEIFINFRLVGLCQCVIDLFRFKLSARHHFMFDFKILYMYTPTSDIEFLSFILIGEN
jgi:hypothetical protein